MLFALSLWLSEVFQELPQPLGDISMHSSSSLTSPSLSLGGSGFVLHGEQESWGWLFSTCASRTHTAACTHFSFFLHTQNTNNTGDSGKGALALR